MTTAAEKRHLARVASLSCVVCDSRGTQVHHLREGQGMGQRASHWLTVALCPWCHTGPHGIHGDRSEMRTRRLDEMDLLAETIRRLETLR